MPVKFWLNDQAEYGQSLAFVCKGRLLTVHTSFSRSYEIQYICHQIIMVTITIININIILSKIFEAIAYTFISVAEGIFLQQNI